MEITKLEYPMTRLGNLRRGRRRTERLLKNVDKMRLFLLRHFSIVARLRQAWHPNLFVRGGFPPRAAKRSANRAALVACCATSALSINPRGRDVLKRAVREMLDRVRFASKATVTGS